MNEFKIARTGSAGEPADGAGFIVRLVDVESGHLLTAGGRRCASRSDALEERFATRAEAEQRSHALLDRLPFAVATIEAQPSGEEVSLTSPHQDEYTRERIRYLAWKRGGWLKRMLRPKPVLRYFDPARSPG